MEKGDISDIHSLVSYFNNYNRLVKPNNRFNIVEEFNKNIKKGIIVVYWTGTFGLFGHCCDLGHFFTSKTF